MKKFQPLTIVNTLALMLFVGALYFLIFAEEDLITRARAPASVPTNH